MKQKAPIYTLPHGIEVIGEYPARGKNPYARLRIRPHPFFPNVRVISNGMQRLMINILPSHEPLIQSCNSRSANHSIIWFLLWKQGRFPTLIQYPLDVLWTS